MMGIVFTSNTCVNQAITLLSAVHSNYSVEMMGLIGAGNNPMVGMTVAVAIEESSK